MAIKAICRDCLWTGEDPAGPRENRCPACESRRVVADAKWKLLDAALDNGEQKYGLSQADFYQLYAYGQKYLDGTGIMYLFYPKTSRFNVSLPPFHFNEQLQLLVVPFDLEREQPVPVCRLSLN